VEILAFVSGIGLAALCLCAKMLLSVVGLAIPKTVPQSD
jgi:hypothetical protein